MLKCMIPCEFFEINTSDFLMLDQYTISKIKKYNDEMNQPVDLNEVFSNIMYLKDWKDFRSNLFMEHELIKVFNDQVIKLRSDPANDHRYLSRKANLRDLLKYF